MGRRGVRRKGGERRKTYSSIKTVFKINLKEIEELVILTFSVVSYTNYRYAGGHKNLI